MEGTEKDDDDGINNSRNKIGRDEIQIYPCLECVGRVVCEEIDTARLTHLGL